jgi:hypothetical protein
MQCPQADPDYGNLNGYNQQEKENCKESIVKQLPSKFPKELVGNQEL